MNRSRWLITIALGLAPMLASMAMPAYMANLKLGLSAAASSSSNDGGKSGGKSNSSSSASKNSSTSSTGSNSSSTGSSSSSSSAVSVGVAPKAKVTNPHGPMSVPCANCHSYTSWKPIRSNPEFNHEQTGYPLRGMHQNVGCTQCHTSMVFKNVGSECADCHADLHKRQFGANCSQCHTVRGWQISMQAIKNHSNRFPLVGGHSVVQCEQCHKQAAVGQFVGQSTTCYSCHQQDFRTPVLDHVGLGFPRTCESCHSLDSWFNAKFDHLKYTGYALSGAHATLPCAGCHINNVFKGTPAQCYSCHQSDFNASNNPPHVQMGLPRDCAICHSTVDWTNAKFDHALYAKYPLTGKHAAVTCAQCHTNNNYNSTPTDCYSLPQVGLPGNEQSSPRFRRVPHRLLAMPHHGGVVDVVLRSQQDQVPVDGRPHHRAVRAVPREQQLHGQRSHRLLRLSPDRLQEHQRPAARVRRFPHHLCHMPQHDELDGSGLRP